MSQKRNMKVRLIEAVGYRLTAIALWGEGQCPGRGNHFHRAEVVLREDGTKASEPFDGEFRDLRDEIVEWKCQHCGEVITTEDLIARTEGSGGRSGSYIPRYPTESGRPEPGDMYFVEWGTCPWHDNCDGKHLNVILPNGSHWDIDGQANNCPLKDERTHRCWVREGEPPNITVGKKGHTCAAGAGSIAVPGWHGFLRNGELIEC